jgi:hypothetical protein
MSWITWIIIFIITSTTTITVIIITIIAVAIITIMKWIFCVWDFPKIKRSFKCAAVGQLLRCKCFITSVCSRYFDTQPISIVVQQCACFIWAAWLIGYMEQSSWEADVVQLIKNFPAFYGAWKFIAVHGGLPLTVSSVSCIQSNPHVCFFNIHFSIILPSDSIYSKGRFPSYFLFEMFCIFLITNHATYPAHLIILDLIILMWLVGWFLTLYCDK